MYLMEIGREGVDWIHLAQHRNQWRVLSESGNEPSDAKIGLLFILELLNSQEPYFTVGRSDFRLGGRLI